MYIDQGDCNLDGAERFYIVTCGQIFDIDLCLVCFVPLGKALRNRQACAEIAMATLVSFIKLLHFPSRPVFCVNLCVHVHLKLLRQRVE